MRRHVILAQRIEKKRSRLGDSYSLVGGPTGLGRLALGRREVRRQCRRCGLLSVSDPKALLDPIAIAGD